MVETVIIIGAGQAGIATAQALRARGFGGQIRLIGAEKLPPYQRPPLSKAYLSGALTDERLLIKPLSFYDDQDITLMTDTRVLEIDPSRRIVHTDRGEFAYDHLVMATGATARLLDPGLTRGLAGIHTLRSAADSRGLQADLRAAQDLLILGGGYVGLEVAAVAATQGLRVTVVEVAERILQRVAAPETSDYFRALHQHHGVTILENRGLVRLVGDARITGVELTDGTRIKADVLLAGIGVLPEVALAERAGVACKNGIVTDAYGRTEIDRIWAVGDCCAFPFRQGMARLESVPHSIDQSAVIAAGIMGDPQPYLARPWFWSDQYDVKLQIAGLNQGYDRSIARPGADEGQFSVWYYRGDQLLAVDAMNDARTYMVARRLLDQGVSPAPELLLGPDLDLKSLLRPVAA